MKEYAQIDKMLNEGKISTDQAKLLKASLHESQKGKSKMAVPPDPDNRERQPDRIWSRVWKILIALVIAIIISIKYKPLFFLLLLMLIIVGCIAVLLLVGYNFLVWKNEKVRQSSALVQNEVNRKSALIPKLRDVVYDYAAIETNTIKKTTQMRTSPLSSSLGSIEESISNAHQAKEFQAVVESYPQIKSNENFARVLNELIETEDRITAMLKWYNYEAGMFNGLIESFPLSAIASLFGLQRTYYLDE